MCSEYDFSRQLGNKIQRIHTCIAQRSRHLLKQISTVATMIKIIILIVSIDLIA